MSYKTKHHSRTSILLLTTLLGFYSITTLTIVESSPSSEELSAGSESLSINSKSSSTSAESSSKEGPLLTFLLRPVEQQPSSDNNAAIHKGGEFYLHHKDNDDNNNDSNVSSESDSGERLRFRREVKVAPPVTGGSKVITTNWGTYEEQAPVVVQSESRTVTDDDSPTFSDVFQSREQDDSSEYTGPVGEGSISYEDYEAGRFEGRQFYPSRSGGYNSGEEQEQPDNYYRQKYYATTAKPLNQQKEPQEGEESEEESEHRPQRPKRPQRPQYRQPQQKEEESTGSGLMGFVQKAKIFYDMFKAMNSAWKTVEDHYRKTGEGIFPEDLKNMNESTRLAITKPYAQEPLSTNNNKKQPNTKRPKTTKAPTTPAEEEEEQQDDTTPGKDEQRSRRSSLHEIVNDNNQETPSHLTTPPSAERSSSTEDSEITESDLESSETDSSSSTAVAEGRYIKGDPLKGYYDFVITEGSYKFWAVFQVGTAILIIYSTFAAIYYSKVSPLVSDYDYIDYLGGGRSLSDDSDFVDTDAPTGDSGSKKVSSKSRQQQQSSAGWFDWVPHAGHTLRFILESIDKGYNEE